ncbi:ABC transporter permease [Gordonia soli]|uniref:Putative amino acid ABC transporter permease protein n=1 Tax=Gordonia soli NBRC 108243 TaxID=1223545 RepID=M0QH69_9ACTN|nr:ABC transporter permease [Gordonia soli]GAC67975.1 putative amino acid ABC transporter permease protein [Gordonia soli NBRC 108243]
MAAGRRGPMSVVRSLGAGATRIRVLNLREIRTHRLRVVTSLAVVIVSSALLIAVLGTYGSLTESVRQFNAAITGTAQVEVAAIADSGVDDAIAGEIRREVPQARSVVPIIRDSIEIGDRQTVLLGSDYRVTALSDRLRDAVSSGDGAEGGSAQGISQTDLDDGVIVGSATGLREGQRVRINGVDVRVLRVVGGDQGAVLNRGNFVFAYLGLAQRLTDLDGKLSSILVVAAPGVDIPALRERVGEVVDGRAVVVDPAFRVKQTEVAGSVVRDATLLVSLISLVIAGFLVFNTMNMAVASRRKSLAMVRALGARRGHLVGDLIGEAAIFGFVGGLIGIPVGILAGRWAIGRLPAASGDQAAIISYHLPIYAPIVGVIACVLACVAATSLAARSVFAVSPVEAMVSGDVADSAPRRRAVTWGAGIVGVLVVIASWVIVDTVPGRPAIVAGAVYAIGGLLICFALSTPLVRTVVAVSRRFGGPGQLAAVNTERSPRRAWATMMTVAVAVAVGIGTSGALANLVGSISSSLDGLGDPDFYVASTKPNDIPLGPTLDPSLEPEIARVPGVAEVVGAQWASVNVGESRVLLQGLTPSSRAPFMRKASDSAIRDTLAGNGIILSNVLSRTLGVGVGDTLRLATPTGYRSLVVRDTVDYVSIDSGTGAIANTLLADWFERPGATYLQVMLDPGADPEQVRAELAAAAARHPSVGERPVRVYSGGEALEATQATAEQSGAFTIAIQWIVAAAAAVALLNTLLLSVIERRRELGVLRAMGASRRFISRMVLAEAAAVAVVGSVIGLVLGSALHLLSDAILTATTSIQVQYSPQLSTLLFVSVAFALCLVGSSVPAARASRMNISESILAD